MLKLKCEPALHLDIAGIYGFMVLLCEDPLRAKAALIKGVPRK